MRKPSTSYFSYYAFWICIFFLVSCTRDKKEDTKPTVPVAADYALTINITNVFGTKPMKFQTDFVTAAKDTIRIKSQFAYYLSNFKFTKADGTVVAPETYFLIHYDTESEDPSMGQIKIGNLPAGNYTKVAFLMGVDSVRNHSGAQTGALDPGYGMIWTWNTGYIFHRLKGETGASNATVTLDIGGDQNIVKYDLTANIALDKPRQLNLKMDIAELFQNPYVYDLKIDDKDIHSTTTAGLVKLVANAKDMFTVTSVE